MSVPATSSRWRDYLALTKPRIIELLLVTTVPTMVLAQQGWPDLRLMLWTLIGGSLASGGANVLNCYYDRDIDALMKRTHGRPSATGAVGPRQMIVFGLILSLLALIVLYLTVNALATGLALAAILFYVVGYTMLLKRRTPQNIVWGGIAGCMPVLIGWAAVTNALAWAPFVLFLIIFFWTPPHYWPLSLRFRDEYEAAGVPMLPVVAELPAVVRNIIRYGWAMVLVSLVLIPVANMGPLYSVTAIVAGGLFMLEAYRLRARALNGTGQVGAMRLFHGSITYLAVVFCAVGLDPFLR